MAKKPVKRRTTKSASKARKRAKLPLLSIHVRYLGAPPEIGTRSISCTLDEHIIQIKVKALMAFQIHSRLAIQFIFRQKVLPDNVTLAQVGFNPQTDVILAMGLQIAGNMKLCSICGQLTSYLGNAAHREYEGKPLCPKCQMNFLPELDDNEISPPYKVQYSYRGKVLPDNIKFAKIGKHPKKVDLLLKRIVSQSNG